MLLQNPAPIRLMVLSYNAYNWAFSYNAYNWAYCSTEPLGEMFFLAYSWEKSALRLFQHDC